MIMPDLITRRPTPSVVAALEGLAALGVDLERVEIIPVSPLEEFKGEIVGQVPHPGDELGARAAITLFVSRDGLSERLPHGLLEPLPTTQDEMHVTLEPGTVPEFWERQVAAFAPGRQFITVIDRALARLGRDIARVETALWSLGHDASLPRGLFEVLGLPDLDFDDDEAFWLATRLHSLPDRIGPSESLASLLGEFLDLPVRCEWVAGPQIELEAADRTPLGTLNARLGESLALGPRFSDAVPALRVRIGPVPAAEHRALDSDPRWWRRIEGMVDLCLPAEMESDVLLELRRSDRGLALGDVLSARLGRSTYLVSDPATARPA